MTTPIEPTDSSDLAPEPSPSTKWKPLDARQRRVLGVLIEKAKTTPAGYPMSVHAVVTGCNQKSNRDPQMTLDDFGVEKALDELRNMGAVSEVDWVGRVAKYKHHAYEWLGVNKPEMAVMAELLLRGAQSLGDLRARAARMEPIADLGALRPIVGGLLERGLMIELTPPGRGQIVSHNLYTEAELEELKSQHGGSGRGADFFRTEGNRVPAVSASKSGVADDRLADLEAQIAELRAEVAQLRETLRELESRSIAARS
jgi:uncharacterized protein YceH (UPF0502 family)